VHGSSKVKMLNLLFILLLSQLLSLLPPVFANGKGPVGIYAINDQYALITDSNFDALLIVDLKWGGTVSVLELTTKLSSTCSKNESGSQVLIDPTGVASCDTCHYAYITSAHCQMFYEVGPFDQPLLKMAGDSNSNNIGNFSSFSEASIRDVWPWSSNMKSKLRMVKVHREGGIGYIASKTHGVLRFKLDSLGKVLEEGDVILENGNKTYIHKTKIHDSPRYTGLSLTNNDNYLLVAGFKAVYILDVTSPLAKAPAKVVYEINLASLCEPKGSILFRNALLVGIENNILYVDGRIGRSMMGGNGISLHRLVLNTQDDVAKWGQCESVVGNAYHSVGWRDKCSHAAAITRPHDMVILPGSENVIIMTDIDNHAIRTVEINNSNANDLISSPHCHCVKTVSYDEGLWYRIKKKQPPPLPRVPFISYVSVDAPVKFLRVRNHCRALKNSDLCTLRDLRHSIFRHEDIWNNYHNHNENGHSVPAFWTIESCEGCWKKDPGVCTNKDPNWDSDYRMLATVNLDGDNFGIQTECTYKLHNLFNTMLRNTEISTVSVDRLLMVICCAENEELNIMRK